MIRVKMVGQKTAEVIDEEIERREELIASFPRVMQERIRSMGLQPGEIEIKIRQTNGLFVDVRKKN